MEVLQHKTLKRVIDPVVVSATDIPFAAAKIKLIRVFSCNKGKVVPIPFQVDEKKDGKYILPEGPYPQKGDGLFNDEDELVFMAEDTGDRCDRGDGWYELEVGDPVDGGKGWVYVKIDPSLPLSDKKYIEYLPEKHRIETTRYFLQFNTEHPIFFDILGIKKEAGGSGKNNIDRMKIRFSAKLIGGFITINKTEEDFETKLISYHAGPVRVVRLTKNWQTLFWKIPSPAAEIVTIFYRDSFEFPVIVDLPFDVGMFLRKVSFRVSVDMLSSAGKRIFYNSNNTSPVEVDGYASKKSTSLDPSNFSWMANAGTGEMPAGWFNRIIWSAPGNPSIDVNLYFKDDLSHSDPPEGEPGEHCDIGYTIKGLESVKKGKIFIKSIMYWFPRFSIEEVRKYMDILDNHLSVKINFKGGEK